MGAGDTGGLGELIGVGGGAVALEGPIEGRACDHAGRELVVGCCWVREKGRANKAYGSESRARKPWSVTVLMTRFPLGSLKLAVAG